MPIGVTRAEALLLVGLPPEQQAWIGGRFAPHLLRTWTEPIRLAGAATAIPTTYVRCLAEYDPGDEDTRRQDERIWSESNWRYREIPHGHNIPFSAPRALAELLLEVAQE